jgi:hypothetical protein
MENLPKNGGCPEYEGNDNEENKCTLDCILDGCLCDSYTPCLAHMRPEPVPGVGGLSIDESNPE